MAKKGDEQDWIVPGKNRQLVRVRGGDGRVKFGPVRRRLFLDHLAATCNVTASAAAAGVSFSAAYRCRMRDAEFRGDWALAIEQGYARLEAELMRRALGGDGGGDDRSDGGDGKGPEPGDFDGGGAVDGPDAPERVDFDKGLALLREHKRGREGGTKPPRLPQRAPIEAVAAKLIRRMKALGVVANPVER